MKITKWMKKGKNKKKFVYNKSETLLKKNCVCVSTAANNETLVYARPTHIDKLPPPQLRGRWRGRRETRFVCSSYWLSEKENYKHVRHRVDMFRRRRQADDGDARHFQIQKFACRCGVNSLAKTNGRDFFFSRSKWPPLFFDFRHFMIYSSIFGFEI